MEARRTLAWIGPALAASVSCGGGGGDGDCAAAGPFPDPPAGAAAVLHVDAGCPTDGADGSAGRPFPTLATALDAAGPGTAILVAPGDYVESLVVAKAPVWVVGHESPAPRPVLHSPDGGTAPAVLVTAGGTAPDAVVTLRGIEIRRPRLAGVWVLGGRASLQGCRVTDSRAVAAGTGAAPEHGYGVVATQGAEVVVDRCEVTGSAAAGILVSRSTGSVRDSTIRSNEDGGIRLQGCLEADVAVEGNTVTDNAGAGIGAYGSRAVVVGNTVEGTRKPAPGGPADGIAVARLVGADGTPLGDATVVVRDNVVRSNERCGVVYAAGSTGAVEGNTLSGNLYAGAWLQGGAGGAAGLAVEDNVLDGNHEVAVGVLGDTRASVRDNEVRGTIPGVAIEGGATVVFAYGVALLGGGAASVTGNRFGAFAPAEGARTAHVLVDHGAAGIEVKTNSPDAAADAVRIVVQNQAAESPVTIVGNAGAAAVEYPPAQPYHLSDPMTDGIGMIGPGGGPPE